MNGTPFTSLGGSSQKPSDPLPDPVFGAGLVNVARARELLGHISPRKFWELSNSGAFPTVRIGRRVLFDPADLRAYADSCKRV